MAVAIVSLLLTGLAFAAGGVLKLKGSRVAVTCKNFGLSHGREAIRFAGPAKHNPCSYGKRPRRPFGDRVGVQPPRRNTPIAPPATPPTQVVGTVRSASGVTPAPPSA